MKYIKLLTLTLLMIMGRGVVSAETIEIPTKLGEFLNVKEAKLEGTRIEAQTETYFGNIYQASSATFTLNSQEVLDGAFLTFMTATARDGKNSNVTVEIKGTDYSYEKNVEIPYTGGWDVTKGTKRLLDLGNLPVGEITLKFTFDNTDGFVGNLGNIAICTSKQYVQEPDNYIPLNGGRYSNSKCPESNNSIQGGYNIGYLGNDSWNEFDFFASEAGRYNLSMGMQYYKGGMMNVKIIDWLTGKEEVNQDIEITQDLAKGYDTETPMLLEASLTKGVKTIKLSFTTTGDWVMNYAYLRLTKADYTLNVSAAKAATLVLPFEATIPVGVKAYKLTAVDANNKITCEEVTGPLPANTPVLVNAEQGAYTFEATEATAKEKTPKAGLLTGVWEAIAVPRGVYVLQNQKGKIAFYKVSSDNITLKANQAYLTVDGVEAEAKSFSFDFGEATGIGSVEAETNVTEKTIYDLQGKKVSKNHLPKVYIVNGKKYISK